MLVMNVTKLPICLGSKEMFQKRTSTAILKRFIPYVINTRRTLATTRKNGAEKIDLDEPIKYTTSPAAKWASTQSFGKPKQEVLWYQPYVVVLSVATFMIYFMALREENDIDQDMNKTLFDHFREIEQRNNIKIEISLPPGITRPPEN